MQLFGSFVAALTSVGLVAVACTTNGSSPPLPRDPLDRLESLGTEWLQTPATITYDTFEHAAGSATSIHQCLRQMVGGAIDRPTAVRMCGGKGQLTLTWDPPDRWRMEVSNAKGTSMLLSTPAGAYQCHRPVGEATRCASTSTTELASDAPFGSLLLPPSQILDTLGFHAAEALTASPEREIADMQAECFSAVLERTDDEANRADWCYSSEGLLLRSMVVEAGGDTEELVATQVLTVVSDEVFDLGRGGASDVR